jgi:hypothetical protein
MMAKTAITTRNMNTTAVTNNGFSGSWAGLADSTTGDGVVEETTVGVGVFVGKAVGEWVRVGV